MYTGTTLTQFIIEEQRHIAGATGDFTALLNDLVTAIKVISNAVNKGALIGVLGALDSQNVQGETQKKLDVITNDIMIRTNEWATGAWRGLQQGQGLAIRKPVTGKVGNVHRHDFAYAGFHRQPIQGGIRQVHFPLARLGVTLHPFNDVAQVMRIEGVNLHAAQFYPAQHFKSLRRAQQIGGLHHARPGSQQPQSLLSPQVPQQPVKTGMVLVIRSEQRQQGAGVKQNVSHAAWP